MNYVCVLVNLIPGALMASTPPSIPQAFVWRRLHSLTGIFLVLFLISHLLTNSQAALFFGEDGHGFIKSVNDIHNLPFLPAIEIGLLAVPILLHLIWGIRYLWTGESNSFSGDGTTPSLPEYGRNKAYTWQRITSWILLIGILGHVAQMRLIHYPTSATVEGQTYYMLPVSLDQGLIPLAERLRVRLLNQKMIDYEKQLDFSNTHSSSAAVKDFFVSLGGLFSKPSSPEELHPDAKSMLVAQRELQQLDWIQAAENWSLKPGEVLAIAPDFGTIELLLVRDTFKSPLMIALYTLFVLAACFHGFNGLWTAMITWGVTLSEMSQRVMLRLSTSLMVLVTFLGLAAIWGTFWINLKQ